MAGRSVEGVGGWEGGGHLIHQSHCLHRFLRLCYREQRWQRGVEACHKLLSQRLDHAVKQHEDLRAHL